ncbi:MAG TPA: GNAT family N-acetyltransferase [Pseudonocardiaceae bacterium]|nr:GNAT family N-acetyltransferase [Pseudonocardiaceae bacterium]
MEERLTVRDDVGAGSYQAVLDGEVVGVLRYDRRGGRFVVRSTVVDPKHRNQGVAGRLVRAALDDAAAGGLSVTNYCGFVTGFLAANPEYLRLVDARFPGKIPA